MPVCIIDKGDFAKLVRLGQTTIGGFFVDKAVDLFPVCRKDHDRNRKVIELHVGGLVEHIHGQSLSADPLFCLRVVLAGVDARSIQGGDVEIQTLCCHFISVDESFHLVWQLIVVAERDVFLMIASGQSFRLGGSYHCVKDFGGVSHFCNHGLHAVHAYCPKVE